MIRRIGNKGQINISKHILDKFGLQEGDLLEVYAQDGGIHLVPVSLYPKDYVDRLESEAMEISKKIERGEQQIFDQIEEMMVHLKDHGE